MNTKFFQMQHNIATEHSAADMVNMAEILSKYKIIYLSHEIMGFVSYTSISLIWFRK